MRKGIIVLGILGLVGLQIGCTALPGSDLLSSNSNGTKTVASNSQFDEIADNPSSYLGQEKRLAGAVVSIDQTDEGYLILAEWLPYPQTQIEEGPQIGQTDRSRHFLIRFIGKREKEFYTTRGNIFLLEGTVEGTQKALVNVFGPRKDLLYVNAKCIRIWETGQDDSRSSQLDNQYPPTRNRTLCAD
jgi:starvation-inducible outer membrane lipoprotein